MNHDYPAVCAALRADALGIFRRATTVAAGRADALAPELRARVASFRPARA
ncbi:MAG TPA: hypothetical protein VMU03_02840 [Gammaproteobacteria bacterium]|nr:hypothetical protein [Gammaproteobacteria bacterium]